MSARSIRRTHRRESVRAARRSRLSRRAGMAAGAAIGLGVAAAPVAQANNFPVTNANDLGVGSLRQAVADANTNGGPDTITFSGAGASGEITLTSGEIKITDDVTITGPGAGTLAISGDANNDNLRTFADNITAGDSRIFEIYDLTPGPALEAVTITGLTLKEGVASEYSSPQFNRLSGGAIDSYEVALALSNVTLTENVATNDGGAVYQNDGSLSISNSLVTANRTLDDGGSIASRTNKYSTPPEQTQITASQVSGNRSGGTNFGGFGSTTNNQGGGLFLVGDATVTGTTIADNAASTTSGGNTFGRGGGAYLATGAEIVSSIVRGNSSGGSGGGLALAGSKVRASTVSGNTAVHAGGGILGLKYSAPARIDDSTISGNTATGPSTPVGSFGAPGGVGGGVVAYGFGGTGTVIRNSTVAANTASTDGGGVFGYAYLPSDEPLANLKSSVVADNSAPTANDDLAQSAPRAFAAGFSMVEAPGGVTLSGDPEGSNITGVDPGLAPLADNGGPTLTHALSRTSAAIDAAQANGFTTDQRGQARTVDAAATDQALSDATDIGAYELQEAAAPGDDPDTAFTKKPPKKLKLKPGKKVAKVTLKFSGTDNAGAPGPLSFECKVDKGAFDECAPPLKLKLGKGKHTILVRATDADGNVDSTPAEATIKVKVKKAK